MKIMPNIFYEQLDNEPLFQMACVSPPLKEILSWGVSDIASGGTYLS